MKHRCPEEERCYVCGAVSELERRLLDVKTAARLCCVSRPTIYRWMREQVVEWIELPMGRRRIFLDSLFKDPPRPTDSIQ